MAKRSAVRGSDYRTVIYGIHAASGTVRSVYVQNDGKMVGTAADGGTYSHHAGGRNAEHEAMIVFGLTDAFSVPVMFNDGASTKQRLQELEAKAAAIRNKRGEGGG